MSKIVFAIVFLAGLIAISSAMMVCPPNYCDQVECEQITEGTCQQQNKLFIPNASFCGCCPVCVYVPNFEVVPGEATPKLCRYPFIGTGEQGYYLC